jgi:hypothetical protein
MLHRNMSPRAPSPAGVVAVLPKRSKRALQRAELEGLRRELVEARALDDRNLLALLAYATSGDGDPMVGLLEEARAMVSVLGDALGGEDERALLLGVERRLAVALEVYARVTAGAERAST